MNLSIATATFYYAPFDKALELIRNSGFEYIELDIYWRGGDNWEAGQHLKDIRPREVLKMVRESGLTISSLHDIGGVIYDDDDSLISPSVYEYLEYGYDDIPCIVFHTLHKRTENKSWWEKYQAKAGKDLQSIKDKIICIENMQYFDGYQVPLINPVDMLGFAIDNGIYVNIDTTHYALAGIDIVEAANILKSRTKGIHLSDYANNKGHLYPGEGQLNFDKFMRTLDVNILHSLTLECNIPYEESNPDISIKAMKLALNYMKDLVSTDITF